MKLKHTMPTSLLATLLIFGLLPVANAHEYDALLKAKKYSEADHAIASKLAIDPQNSDALIAKVDLILNEGKESRLDEAVKAAELCISAHPKNSECHESLGNVLGTKAQLGGVMSAISYVSKIKDSFRTAVELDPKNFSARGSLPQFYLQAPGFVGGSTSKAHDLIVETIKINPSAGALLQANFDLYEKNFERAASATLAVNTDANPVLARQQRKLLSNLGRTYINNNRLADAEKIYTEMSQRFPDSAAAYFGLGKSILEQGKAKEAIPHLEKSLSLEVASGTYYRLGKAWQALTDKTKALAFYEKALAALPELAQETKTDIQKQIKALK